MEYICKYCGRKCKNLNSLTQHEIRCHSNPNRITNCGNHGATKGYPGYKSFFYIMYILLIITYKITN